MHVIMYRNDDRVCKALPDSLNCLSGCLQKLLPGIKDEGSVELMIAGKDIAGFCPRFCDSDDLALIWVVQGICGIVLCAMSVDWQTEYERILLTVPLWPQPMTANVIG